MTLARTAVAQGAVVLNHCPVTALVREAGRVSGVVARDDESGAALKIAAKCVVNATGVWVDALRDMDRTWRGRTADIVAPSQGVHLVVDRSFLPGTTRLAGAEDARRARPVCRAVAGQDDPRHDRYAARRPRRRARTVPDEVAFILREAGRYLARRRPVPTCARSGSGLRPLVKPPTRDDDADTKRCRASTPCWSADRGWSP